jgi:hypothetical protein
MMKLWNIARVLLHFETGKGIELKRLVLSYDVLIIYVCIMLYAIRQFPTKFCHWWVLALICLDHIPSAIRYKFVLFMRIFSYSCALERLWWLTRMVGQLSRTRCYEHVHLCGIVETRPPLALKALYQMRLQCLSSIVYVRLRWCF